MQNPAFLALAFLLLAGLALREMLQALVWPRWRHLTFAVGLMLAPVFGIFLAVVTVRVI